MLNPDQIYGYVWVDFYVWLLEVQFMLGGGGSVLVEHSLRATQGFLCVCRLYHDRSGDCLSDPLRRET